MNLKEDIRSVTYLKTRPAELIDRVNKNHRPVVITQNGEAKAVVQDIATYEATRKALLLLKMIAQSEAELRKGRGVPQAVVFDRIAKRLARG